MAPMARRAAGLHLWQTTPQLPRQLLLLWLLWLLLLLTALMVRKLPLQREAARHQVAPLRRQSHWVEVQSPQGRHFQSDAALWAATATATATAVGAGCRPRCLRQAWPLAGACCRTGRPGDHDRARGRDGARGGSATGWMALRGCLQAGVGHCGDASPPPPHTHIQEQRGCLQACVGHRGTFTVPHRALDSPSSASSFVNHVSRNF